MPELKDTPEFMVELRRALAVAVQDLGLASRPATEDPTHVWLTTAEAMRFVRRGPSAWQRFKSKYAAKLRVSHLFDEPLYRLDSLQLLLEENAKGGPQPELDLDLGKPKLATTTGTFPGKQRNVGLRVAGGRP